MAAEQAERTEGSSRPGIDWEAFYRNYRKPGYVTGFEIANKLGGGVFGMVFKARKESIGKDYAIKFLKVDDEVVRDAVVRELDTVRLFAQIDHPNLVSIEDKGEVDGIPYIVMNYAGQGTLRRRLEAGGMERDEALRIFVQAARGVQALHSHSLVHFDLKPANIFLKGDIARVGDYGLSKLITESRNSLSFGRGTPYYMAPEMLKRRGDERSDIYSLGVILFECLTGDVPFKGDSEWEVLRKHETEEPQFPESLADSDRQVIARCMAKDPDQRFQSVEEILRVLQAPSALGESLVFAAPRSGPAPSLAGAAGIEGLRDPKDSPYGLPWNNGQGGGGLLGGLVHLIFRVFELVILVMLLPVRLISTVSGRGVVYVLTLPFRILGFTAQVAGFALIACLVVMLVLGFLLTAA